MIMSFVKGGRALQDTQTFVCNVQKKQDEMKQKIYSDLFPVVTCCIFVSVHIV